MATTAAVVPVEEVEEAPRPSLLDAVISEYDVEKDLRTSRLLLTAEMHEDVRSAERENLLMKFFQDFIDKHESEGRITGVVFLLNKTGVVMCIEAPTAILLSLLRLCQEGTSTNLFQIARILSVTEEVPREYSAWVVRHIMDFPTGEFAKPREWLGEIFAVLQGFLELAREMVGMDADAAETYLLTTSTRPFIARIPSIQSIQGYAKHGEDLCSVAEYLEIFDAPVKFTLEGELMWPAEPPLKY